MTNYLYGIPPSRVPKVLLFARNSIPRLVFASHHVQFPVHNFGTRRRGGYLAHRVGVDRRYRGNHLRIEGGEGNIISEGTAARLGEEKFVSLTTFKRNGDAIASPMWIVRDGKELLVWTPADAAKVKRIRRDPRVTLTACGRTGKVKAGQPAFEGTATVFTDSASVARAESLIKQKYGLEFRVVTLIETIVARGRKPRIVMPIMLSSSNSDEL